jgi:hypothetical protein
MGPEGPILAFKPSRAERKNESEEEMDVGGNVMKMGAMDMGALNGAFL